MCIVCDITKTPGITENILFGGYIDPGTGFTFTSSAPAFFGFFLAFFGSIMVFLRKFISTHKKLSIIIIFLVTLLIAGFIAMQKINKKNDQPKVIVLGFDGMDPEIIEEGWKRGLFPNFSRLKNFGGYSKLKTTVPPQSPVAWASFITGKNPSGHGVYDFIVRDPSTYSLSLAFSSDKKLIKTKTFWNTLSENKIHSTILFLPDTYPPDELEGEMISGMGVPDVTGTEGSFTLFTTKGYKIDPKWRGRVVKIAQGDEIKSVIPGPKHTFLNETKISEIPVTFKKDEAGKTIDIFIKNKKITLNEKEYSDWIRLDFSIDFFTKVRGIAKFYVKSIGPETEIYLSPINFNPENPVYPISYPKNLSRELSNKFGLFSTLGLPHDTWALEENILDEAAFLKQVDSVLSERKGIYVKKLAEIKSGTLVAYFGMTDTVSHMFWRYLGDNESKYQNTVFDYYQKMDEIVGETVEKLKEGDTLVVLSDHGFHSFDYEFNVNSWLKKEGYLVLRDNESVGHELLENVDWSKTRAYSVGYNGIYLNMKDRERSGIVDYSASEALSSELREKLLELKNEETKLNVVKHMYLKSELGIAEKDTTSPDLFIGYYKSTRSSWDTAVGATPKEIFVPRESKWSGDHLFDPSEVPGVIFSNKKIKKNSPEIIDIAPSILEIYGILEPGLMDGRGLY